MFDVGYSVWDQIVFGFGLQLCMESGEYWQDLVQWIYVYVYVDVDVVYFCGVVVFQRFKIGVGVQGQVGMGFLVDYGFFFLGVVLCDGIDFVRVDGCLVEFLCFEWVVLMQVIDM